MQIMREVLRTNAENRSGRKSTCGLRGAPPTALVVGDEPILRGLLARMMADAGYAVLGAEHGEAALMQVRRCGAALRLVITDINMPVMDGIELARMLESVQPGTPVLFITGRGSDSESVVEAWGELLRKPFRPDQLLEKVAGILTRAGEARRSRA